MLFKVKGYSLGCTATIIMAISKLLSMVSYDITSAFFMPAIIGIVDGASLIVTTSVKWTRLAAKLS